MSAVDQFRAASPGRQLLLVGFGILLIGALLGGLYMLVLRRPYVVLFESLRPAEAAAIVTVLDDRKELYRLRDGGATILSPADRADAVRLSLAGEDLPLIGGVGFELFNKSDMGLTEFAQRINYQRALQGELARTLMTVDGVESARVHLALSEPTVFRGDRRPPKASVTLQTRSGQPLSTATIQGVQQLVAAAAPDLQAASVVVLDNAGRIVSGAPPNATSVSVGPMAAYEEELRRLMVHAGFPGERSPCRSRACPTRETSMANARSRGCAPPSPSPKR